ncbi:MAG: tRNA (adenosine(37)-N6)-threonylcarbamoyltransferase complex ATPase subunit type 1 TsaE [Acidobacteria bacterium]|nr:MAG: tRNA (adenosine(37)-N6)-threonylcarbamoyltransferase complex ATPase subunit type 1 TsaE [Acidobacteriota bacterium]MCL4286445.1 tRNA (adenosine(37)-N6)-threonylcarbamoyltransferase complex ATPase subunit type 1 TsaE [Thermoleophilia bacterium]GIK77240.1 MAG: tRNA threonylcarbamoyladenosine biosynthesis protein TsaE [Actinomycetes bacterium]
MAAETESERIRSGGPERTEAAAAALAAELRPGDVVLLRGGLGTGKTTFVRGAARALGVTEPVTSPTFTIGRRYEGDVAISHLDLHRLAGSGLAAEDPGMLDDYLTADAVAFVEWPEAAAAALVAPAATVTLAHAGGDAREITIERHGP